MSRKMSSKLEPHVRKAFAEQAKKNKRNAKPAQKIPRDAYEGDTINLAKLKAKTKYEFNV